MVANVGPARRGAAGCVSVSSRSWPHRGYIAAEVDDRTERRRTRRINEAEFPRIKRLAEFNTEAVPSIRPPTIAHLAAGNSAPPSVALSAA